MTPTCGAIVQLPLQLAAAEVAMRSWALSPPPPLMMVATLPIISVAAEMMIGRPAGSRQGGRDTKPGDKGRQRATRRRFGFAHGRHTARDFVGRSLVSIVGRHLSSFDKNLTISNFALAKLSQFWPTLCGWPRRRRLKLRATSCVALCRRSFCCS